jgi:hypothetical protein
MGAALYKLPQREARALFVRKRATQRVVLRQGGARRSGGWNSTYRSIAWADTLVAKQARRPHQDTDEFDMRLPASRCLQVWRANPSISRIRLDDVRR